MSKVSVFKHNNQASNFNNRRKIYDPFYLLQTDINKLFGHFSNNDLNLPSVNVIDSKDKIKINVELPGIDAKDVDISFNRNYLTIRAKREEEKTEEGENYVTKEQSYGMFERSFSLPAEINMEKSAAKFDKGILTITIPKRTEKLENIKKIKIET